MRKVSKIWGYCRVSTEKQSLLRQEENIKTKYPTAVIYKESYTGTTMSRPIWNNVFKQLKSGDTIVFDEISRMSRNAEEGFTVYKELYERGVNIVFLKEPALNSENFRQTTQLAMTGSDFDIVLEALNKYLMILAEKQIKAAFDGAQHEVDSRRISTKEGIQKSHERYQMEEALGLPHEKQWSGRKPGSKIETKKAKEMKAFIRKHSKDFDGTDSDKELLKICKINRNTYYSYKRQIREELQSESK